MVVKEVVHDMGRELGEMDISRHHRFLDLEKQFMLIEYKSLLTLNFVGSLTEIILIRQLTQ